MTNQTWRIVAAILAVILAVLGGATIAFVIAPGPGATATPPPSFAAGSPTGSGSPGASGSAPASAPPSESAPSDSASPSASPTPSPTPAPIAQLTFTSLVLEQTDPTGAPRYITFTSDGPQTVTAQLKAISPQGTTHMCLRAGSKDIKCGDSANATIKATTTSAHVTWRVSLQGTGMFTPTVELTITFRAATPSVKITHARFDGTGHPDTNGIQAIFVPRAAGAARVVSSWGAHSFLFKLDAVNQSSGTGGATLSGGPTTSGDQSFAVTAGETWKVTLTNQSTPTATTYMTATISWP